MNGALGGTNSGYALICLNELLGLRSYSSSTQLPPSTSSATQASASSSASPSSASPPPPPQQGAVEQGQAFDMVLGGGVLRAFQWNGKELMWHVVQGAERSCQMACVSQPCRALCCTHASMPHAVEYNINDNAPHAAYNDKRARVWERLIRWALGWHARKQAGLCAWIMEQHHHGLGRRLSLRRHLAPEEPTCHA